jgi:hypothetical protein
MRVAFALGVVCLGLAAGASTAAAVPIQPGAFVEVGSHPCTLGFVFDGIDGADGREFITTAAHCVDNVGQHALDGRGTTIGRVALVGPGSAGPAGDVALIEIGISRVPSVRSAVRGHTDYPTGSTVAADTPGNDPISISGYGDPYVSKRDTREQRQGRLRFDDDLEFQALGPIATGDSGAPIVEISSGKAIGTVADLCYGDGADCDAARGPTVAHILDLAAGAGLPLRLRRAHDPLPRQLVIKAESQRLRTLRPIARLRATSSAIRVRMRRRATVRLRIQRRHPGYWSTVRVITRRLPQGTTAIHFGRAAGGRHLAAGHYRVAARLRFGSSAARRPVRVRFVVRGR